MSVVHRQSFLFLQGPVSPFFARLAAALEARGHRTLRVNLCFGDRLVWNRPGAIDYRGTFADWPAFVGALIDREGITDLVMLGEQRPYHLAAAAEARRRNVTVSVTDFGYLRPDWLTLERDGMGSLSWFPRTPAGIRALADAFPEPDLAQRYYADFGPQAAWDVAYNLSSLGFGFLYPRYRSHHIYNPILGHLGSGWRMLNDRRRAARADAAVTRARAAGESYWLFPMQMELDYSIRAYSPYDGMTAPLKEVIAAFARGAPSNGRLFIKVHPFDPGLRDWSAIVARIAREAGVAERVSFVDAGSLEAMLAGAVGVVTVNSTVGLMALQSGLPTKALGHAVYNVEGLTFQGELDRFWRDGAGPEPKLMAAFLRAVAGALHIRGVYYNEPGLSAAVGAAAERLHASETKAIADAIARAVPSGEEAERPLRRWAI